MDNNSKNQKSNPEELYYKDLTEEQKEEVRAAYVASKKAEARAKEAMAKKAEAEVKTQDAETDNVKATTVKTEAEAKKAKVEKYVAIGGIVIAAAGLALRAILPVNLMKRTYEHNDEQVMRLTDPERRVEESTLSETIRWGYGR